MKKSRVIDKNLKQAASYYISDISHNKEVSTGIYEFMKKFNIGESEYGKIMDLAAEGKHVMAHRLYGHHLIYDFPADFKDVPDFMSHIFSDLFTDMGIPILPGEVLENTRLLDYCKSINSSNWNFINGFDILAATASIYSSSRKFIDVINEKTVVEDFKDLANTVGIGALELALACSTANPFLLVGSFLHIASGVQGIMNDGGIIYINKMTDHFRLEVVANDLTLETLAEKNYLENKANGLSMKTIAENNMM